MSSPFLKPLTLITSGLSLVVVLACGYGLYLSGTPSQVRLFNLDSKRSADLAEIKYAVDAYWQEKKELPTNLNTLFVTVRNGAPLPQDPTTQQAYEYSSTGNATTTGTDPKETYQLCALFSLDTTRDPSDSYPGKPMVPTPQYPSFGRHPAGHYCFDVAIAH